MRELSDVRCPIFDVQCSVCSVWWRPVFGVVVVEWGNEGGIETRYYEEGKNVEACDGRADGVDIKRGQVE